MSEYIMNWRAYLLDNLANLVLMTIVFYYILFRIFGRKEQKRLWFDNFEWWAYRGLVDMYKNQGYPYPEIDARDKINQIIKEYKVDNSIVLENWIIIFYEFAPQSTNWIETKD